VSLGPEYGDTLDTGDVMRSRVFDFPPGARLEDLLSAIGAGGLPISRQQAALREWLETSAAIPAPPRMLKSVRSFLEVDND
jgi:hypothetical protein